MDNKHYVLTKSDVQKLGNLLRDDRNAPPPAMIPRSEPQYTKAPDAYWALPPCETGLPAAVRNADGSISPGVAKCCLYKYDEDANRLVPLLDAVGIPFRAVIRNSYLRSTNDFVQVYRHKDGTWTNERPDLVVQTSTTTTTTTANPNAGIVNSVCRGSCLWVAAPVTGGVGWKDPIGGCSNTTTTTTTAAPTTTTSTTAAPATTTTTTTQAPCEKQPPCRLRCVAGVTTTVGPGTTTSWPPPPSTGYVYQVISGACNSPCNCYGAGDPCFLLNGEIDSRCVYVTPTTTASPTTTTTSGPLTSLQACTLANTALSTPAPGTYRAATIKSFSNAWTVCQDCPAGQMPLFPLGSKEASDPAPDKQFVVHDSPCALDPCSLNTQLYPEGRAVYRALTLADQQWYWNSLPGSSDVIYSDADKYLANWRICQQCPSGLRPALPPSAWINKNGSGNPELRGDGMFYYETTCVAGPDCNSCKLAASGAFLPESTTTTVNPSQTTPAPTTTIAPCGCVPPSYCPTVSGECVRTECVPGGAGAAGKPACPTTTTGPNQCFDGRKVCICGSTTTTTTTTTTRFPVTTTPIGGCGNCSWLAARNALSETIQWVQTAGCICGGCSYPGTSPTSCGQTTTTACTTAAPTTTTTAAPGSGVGCTCAGTCIYVATASWSGITGQPVTYSWRLSLTSTCGCGGWGCGCPCPSDPPTSACDIVETFCGGIIGPIGINGPYNICNGGNPPYVECACCTTQACDKYCTFKGNGTGGWTKINDPCPTTCPCPAYPPSNSQSDCDMRRYKCGSVTPTTTSTSPPSTTTTTPAPGACCRGCSAT